MRKRHIGFQKVKSLIFVHIVIISDNLQPSMGTIED